MDTNTFILLALMVVGTVGTIYCHLKEYFGMAVVASFLVFCCAASLGLTSLKSGEMERGFTAFGLAVSSLVITMKNCKRLARTL